MTPMSDRLLEETASMTASMFRRGVITRGDIDSDLALVKSRYGPDSTTKLKARIDRLIVDDEAHRLSQHALDL